VTIPQDTREAWLLMYHPDGTGKGVPWLLLHDVPRGTLRDELLSRLADWRKWDRWSSRAAIGSRFTVKRAKGIELSPAGREYPAFSWDELAPAEVRVSVPMPGALHAELRRRAARDGLALQVWVVEALAAYLDALPGAR
jgi:hypothetical protein